MVHPATKFFMGATPWTRDSDLASKAHRFGVRDGPGQETGAAQGGRYQGGLAPAAFEILGKWTHTPFDFCQRAFETLPTLRQEKQVKRPRFERGLGTGAA